MNESMPKVNENKLVKILWDFEIFTHTKIPDLIIHKKQTNIAIVIDFSIPWDDNINKKYANVPQQLDCIINLTTLKKIIKRFANFKAS